MRIVFWNLLLGASLALVLPWSPETATCDQMIGLRGTDYVWLAEWPRVQDLNSHWLKRDESFKSANRSMRLQFLVGPCEVRANGLQLWALIPLASRDGDISGNQLDADTTLQPVLAPPRNVPGLKTKTIRLDSRRGARKSGYRIASKFEAGSWLRLAFKLHDQLQLACFKASLKRYSDKTVELANRPAPARRNKAELFVSLHFNATDGSRDVAKGAEVCAFTPTDAPSTNPRGEGSGGWQMDNQFDTKNLLLVPPVQRSLVREFGAEDPRVRYAGSPCGAPRPCRSFSAGLASCRIPRRKVKSLIQPTLEARRGGFLTPFLATTGLCRG